MGNKSIQKINKIGIISIQMKTPEDNPKDKPLKKT
jgi:hypothetical protein